MKHQKSVASLSFLGVALAALVVGSRMGPSSSLDARAFLAEGIAPPSTLGAHWVQQRPDLELEDDPFDSESNASRSWSFDEQGPMIVRQRVLTYGSKADASAAFDEGWRARWENPDYVAPVQADELYVGGAADDAHVMCAGQDVENCRTWIYWGRYSRVIVEVFYGFGTALPGHELSKLVAEIETRADLTTLG